MNKVNKHSTFELLVNNKKARIGIGTRIRTGIGTRIRSILRIRMVIRMIIIS